MENTKTLKGEKRAYAKVWKQGGGGKIGIVVCLEFRCCFGKLALEEG